MGADGACWADSAGTRINGGHREAGQQKDDRRHVVHAHVHLTRSATGRQRRQIRFYHLFDALDNYLFYRSNRIARIASIALYGPLTR